MPNQLASAKCRRSLAEHEAVLAAIAAIAQHDGVTTMAVLRRAARAVVQARAADPAQAERLRAVVMPFTPKVPARFATAAELARFKRRQREFDQVLIDLHLVSSQAVQARNSVVRAHCRIRALELESRHAGPPVA